jgi:GntR family transcriptional regulator
MAIGSKSFLPRNKTANRPGSAGKNDKRIYHFSLVNSHLSFEKLFFFWNSCVPARAPALSGRFAVLKHAIGFASFGRSALMEFYIDKHSSTPVASQIQEQIKLAVMMGVFRNGDTLPSIRDIEKQTGINRSQIHKAYLALRKSGLLVLTRGKGTTVFTAADSPRITDESCRKLSKDIVDKARRMGMSPTAFARYLSRFAQEAESKTPFIIFADAYKEIAVQTAEEISQLWHVPVVGMAYRDLKTVIGKGGVRRKILVSHWMHDNIRAMLSRNKSDVIPVEVVNAEQTIKAFDKIKPNSTMLAIHLPQPAHRIGFILSEMKKLVEPRGITLSSFPVKNRAELKKLIKNSNYDYYFIGPGVRGEVPSEMWKDPRILQVLPELDPASLEAARIRAGVII